jgi:hypothetical protein
VRDTRRHRSHPDRGPTVNDRKPPRSARKKKSSAWPTHAPNNPRTGHRRPTGPDLAAAEVEGDGERGWGGAYQSEVGEEEQIWLPKFEEKM